FSKPLFPLFTFLATLPAYASELYWTEFVGQPNDGAILRADLETGQISTVIQGISGPNRLALDLAGGKMYWSSLDLSPQRGGIWRANLDGTGRERVVSRVNANETFLGLAFDPVGQRLIWSRGGSTVWSTAPDGSDARSFALPAGSFVQDLNLDPAS